MEFDALLRQVGVEGIVYRLVDVLEALDRVSLETRCALYVGGVVLNGEAGAPCGAFASLDADARLRGRRAAPIAVHD